MKYTTAKLTDILKEWYEEHDGQAPTQTDFNNDKKLPSAKTYIRTFGSWNKALRAAQISVPIEMRLAGFNEGQLAAIMINMVRRAYNRTKGKSEGIILPYINVKEVLKNGTIRNEGKQ